MTAFTLDRRDCIGQMVNKMIALMYLRKMVVILDTECLYIIPKMVLWNIRLQIAFPKDWFLSFFNGTSSPVY